MKRLALCILGIMLWSPSYGAVVEECEKLELAHQQLINRNDFFSLCNVLLNESKNSLTLACDSLAIGRRIIAIEALGNSFDDLNVLSKANCRASKKIKILSDQVKAFQLTI